MPVYSDDGAQTLAPRILTFSGWSHDGGRVSNRLLSGDYHAETIGSARKTGELTALFAPDELALKDSFVASIYDSGLLQVEVREGRWHVEVLGDPQEGRWKPEAEGSTRLWYTVSFRVLRGAAV
jgi:hypothetical protein